MMEGVVPIRALIKTLEGYDDNNQLIPVLIVGTKMTIDLQCCKALQIDESDRKLAKSMGILL
jgi:hypothetical protein